MDLGHEILSKCSWAYHSSRYKFKLLKPYNWHYRYYDYDHQTTYHVTTKLVDHPEYSILIQHGLHFLFSDFNNSNHFKCFMVIDGNCITAQNDINDAWTNVNSYNDKDKWKDVHVWQIHILNDLQTRRSIFLKQMKVDEIYLPLDVHQMIANYMFGITFLQLSE